MLNDEPDEIPLMAASAIILFWLRSAVWHTAINFHFGLKAVIQHLGSEVRFGSIAEVSDSAVNVCSRTYSGRHRAESGHSATN